MDKKPLKPHPARQLEQALDAAVEESQRLARELVDAEEGLRIAADLVRLLVNTWRSGRDLGPVVDQVETTLQQLRRTN